MHEGERIHRIRLSLGLTQDYVAREVGISPSALSHIEHAKQVLSYRLAVRLARLFMCDLGAFDDALGGPLRTIVPALAPPPEQESLPTQDTPPTGT